jgi:hypothetical protein
VRLTSYAPLGTNLKAPVTLRSANLEETGDPICDMFLLLRIATQTHEIQVLGFKIHSDTKWKQNFEFLFN